MTTRRACGSFDMGGGSAGYQYWLNTPIPAAHGSFYLEVASAETPIGRGAKAGVSLKMLGENRPLADLGTPDGFDMPADRFGGRGGPPSLPHYDRVFLIPEAKAMVVLNGKTDKVIVHKLDVDELLAKSDFDFLFVTGKPAAERGAAFAYTPVVKSKKGGVKLKLEAGPDGMKVEGGKVVWAVPKDFGAAEVPVILRSPTRSARRRSTPSPYR